MSDSNQLQTVNFDIPPPYFQEKDEKSHEIVQKIEEKSDVPAILSILSQGLSSTPSEGAQPPSYDEFSEETLEEIIKTFRIFMKRRFAIKKDINVDVEKQYNMLRTEFVQLCNCEIFIEECRKKYIAAMQDTFNALDAK